MGQKKKDNLKTLAIVLLFLLLLYLSFKASRTIRDLEDSKASIVLSLQGELKTYQQKDSSWVAEKRALVSDYKTLKLLANSQDSTIRNLAKKLSKHTPVVIAHSTETVIQASGVPTVTIDTITEKPTYKYTFRDKWQYGEITASADRVYLNCTSINEFGYSVEWKNTGLFKPRVAFVQATNNNPKSTTTDLNALVIQVPKVSVKEKTIAGGLLIGLGVGIGLMIK